MVSNYTYSEESRSRGRYSDTSLDNGYTHSLPPTSGDLASAYSLISNGADGSPYAHAMQTMQSSYGNRALQRFIGSSQSVEGYAGGISASTGTSSIMGLEDQRIPFSMPGEETRLGWQHPTDGTGGYAFWESQEHNISIPGIPFTIPLHDFETGIGLDLGGTNVIGANASGGSWEAEDGSTRFGGKFDAGIGLDGLGLGMEGFKVEGEGSVGSSGFTFGGGTTLIGAELSSGDAKFSDSSTNEDFVGVGLNAGISAGVSGHWGDSDGDGYRELGFGIDAGPLSFNVKSEDPLRTMMNGIPGVGLATSFLDPNSNLTYDALGMAGSAMDWMAGGLTSALDWASPMWMGDPGGLDPIPQKETAGMGGSEGLMPWW